MTPVEKHQSTLDKLTAIKERSISDKRDREQEIRDLIHTIGERRLLLEVDGAEDLPGEQAADVAFLRNEIETLDSMIAQAGPKIVEEQALLKDALADEKVERAAKLRQDADQHEVKTKEFLEALRAHEGVDYVPQPPGQRFGPYGGQKGGTAPTTVIVPTPKSQMMRLEAAQLESEAFELKRGARQLRAVA